MAGGFGTGEEVNVYIQSRSRKVGKIKYILDQDFSLRNSSKERKSHFLFFLSNLFPLNLVTISAALFLSSLPFSICSQLQLEFHKPCISVVAVTLVC